MTRDQAVQRLRERFADQPADAYILVVAEEFVDAIETLGLLKFDAPVDRDEAAAIQRLHGLKVQVCDYQFPNMPGPTLSLTGHGAWLVREGLRKAGFKITRV